MSTEQASEPISGTVSLLFTDIEGSTRLLDRLGHRGYAATRGTHDRLLREAFRRRGGRVVDNPGDGFFVVFGRATDAVAAAVDAQRALARQPWPEGALVRVRMGLHTGEPAVDSDKYVGMDVHRASRICNAGHGGQVLLSEVTRTLVERDLPPDISLRDLGQQRLKDLPQPGRIFQIVAPDLPADFPPLRTLPLVQHNLPIQRTQLIGREQEVAAVSELLLRADVGLVTLTGPAGTGKTRLALEVATTLLDAFEDGVYFVALAPIGEPELVASAVVRALGLQEAGGTPLEETLKSHLRDRRTLLLLDNFEHLLPAATLVAELLASCPKLKILATSRAILHLYGEQDFPVPPLALPDPERPVRPEELLEYSAITLFDQRAKAVERDFAVTPSNSATLEAICARLDGLPLAIELAAARVRLLRPEAILARLERRLPLLTGGARDLPARHQTLRGAIGWSYELLEGAEQVLFRRLAIFVGGFGLEAAEAVCAFGAGASERESAGARENRSLSVLDGIASLVDQSLLQQRPAASGEPRFWMLETIREFGLEQLEANRELEPMRRRHTEYYLALADEGERKVGGSEQAEWLARLDEEQPNFRAALTWSLLSDGGEAELGVRTAAALWVFWFRRGYLHEGSRWLQQALRSQPTAPAALRAKLLTADGSIARLAGEFPRAEKLLEAGAALYRELGDDEGVAWALSHLGLVKQWLGQLDLGVEMLEESLALRRALGDQRGIARSLFNLGVAEDFRSNYERAAQRYEETLEAQRAVGDTWGIGRVCAYLGEVALRQGDSERAEALCREGLPLSQSVHDNWGAALALENLGRIAAARRDFEEAEAHLKDALAMFRDVGARDRVAECLLDCAALARMLGDSQRATRLSAAAEAAQQRTGLPFWPAVSARRNAEMAAARVVLGETAFNEAWSEGLAMSLEQAIDYALTVDGGP